MFFDKHSMTQMMDTDYIDQNQNLLVMFKLIQFYNSCFLPTSLYILHTNCTDKIRQEYILAAWCHHAGDQ